LRAWQTVITAAGEDNASFREGGFSLPKNLIPFNGATILGSSIKSYGKGSMRTHVVIRRDEANAFKTNTILLETIPNLDFVLIPQATRGALCSAAMTIDALEPDVPLVVAPGDSFVTEDISSLLRILLEEDSAAGTILFESSLPRWSYARMNKERQILEMGEKSQISKFASTGVFYFKSPELFMQAAEWVLKQNMHTGGEFYLSTALNYLIMNGKNVLGVKLPHGIGYTPLSTLRDLKIAEEASDATF
jgi:hypothetical protein